MRIFEIISAKWANYDRLIIRKTVTKTHEKMLNSGRRNIPSQIMRLLPNSAKLPIIPDIWDHLNQSRTEGVYPMIILV